MALIYASAVNKRMNSAPKKKRSLNERDIMEASYSSAVHYRQRSNESVSHHIDGQSRTQRKRSTSQHSGTPSSCNCTPPPSNSASINAAALKHEEAQRARRQIQRSKTSAGEVKRKYTTICQHSSQPRTSRKISTPVMSQSVMIDSSHGCSNCGGVKEKSLRKSLAKKRFIKETAHDPEERACLAVSDESSDPAEEGQELNRSRRSASLNDRDTGKGGEYEDLLSGKNGAEDNTHISTFQRMCARFQKWKLGSTSRDEDKEQTAPRLS